MIKLLNPCKHELKAFPIRIREDLADALARLEEGHFLSMPLSRPMPSIGKGVHELRFRDSSGIYRVMYVLLGAGVIYLLHAFNKKAQQTPKRNLEIVKKRLKEVSS